MAVVAPHRIGLAGGFFATVYIRQSKNVTVLDAREAAPRDINESELKANSSRLPYTGGRAVAVPALVPGLEALHSRFGKLPWSSLFDDAIKLARFGFPVYSELAAVLAQFSKAVSQRRSLRRLFWNPRSNRVYRDNEMLRQPALALTLMRIAHHRYKGFLRGNIGTKFLQDLGKLGALSLPPPRRKRREMVQIKGQPADDVAWVGRAALTTPPPPPPGSRPLLLTCHRLWNILFPGKGVGGSGTRRDLKITFSVVFFFNL
ncbi:unnamed protein product [Ixodes hexagonus]